MVLETNKRGKCAVCRKRFSRSGMTKHMLSHIPGGESGNRIIMKVSDPYGLFWMFLEIDGKRKLLDLDSFLRNEWMECCGHLSMFTIDGTDYWVNSDETEYDDMRHRLDSVLEKDSDVTYEYDFGSTTALRVQVVHMGAPTLTRQKTKVTVLARNDPVKFRCDSCKGPATYACSGCGPFDGVFCSKCAEEHECGMEMMLSTCQSPRVGTCGYEG